MIEQYAASVYGALMRDLSDVEEALYATFNGKRERSGSRKRRPYPNEIEVYSFPQSWGSTALGFGGIGGQASTTATTVVVTCGGQACVYFGGQFAYKVEEFGRSQAFQDDLRRHDMADVAKAFGRYEQKKVAKE